MTVTARIAAKLDTAQATYVTPQTVVALPASSLDPAADKMRVRINGVEITREYDPVLEQP